jgi:thiol-disulfide isomerase/thioredoxin
MAMMTMTFKKVRISFILFSLFLLASCSKRGMETGFWKFKLEIQEKVLPFYIEIRSMDPFKGFLYNGREKIQLNEINLSDNKVEIPLGVNQAKLEGMLESSLKMNGHWVREDKDDYKLPFKANYIGKVKPSDEGMSKSESLDGKWQVTFPEEKDSFKAIALFDQEPGSQKVYGSVVTPTGDYRYLEGVVKGNLFTLKGFDGMFAILIDGKITEQEFKADLHWGKTYHSIMLGVKNNKASIEDPYRLTKLKNKKEVSFELPDLNGDLVKLDKVSPKIIQIFGSWCPNCLDESRYYAQWLRRHKKTNIKFYAVAYERSQSKDEAIKRLKKVKKKLGMTYPILLADFDGKKKVTDMFPMIEKVMSFPTTLFLDKKNRIMKVHTGFYGPGTGAYHDQFKREFEAYLKKFHQPR